MVVVGVFTNDAKTRTEILTEKYSKMVWSRWTPIPLAQKWELKVA